MKVLKIAMTKINYWANLVGEKTPKISQISVTIFSITSLCRGLTKKVSV